MLDKLDFLNNLSDDERKLFTGIGLVVLGVFAMFILSQLLIRAEPWVRSRTEI